MWTSQIRRALRSAANAQSRGGGSGSGSVGILLDVDGVVLRGGSVIPAARRAFGKLLDERRRFRFPVVFVTNAGSCQARQKAAQLSAMLDVHISPAQVVLSYSPLKMLTGFHDKCVLVSGQGPVTDIARTLGFKKVVSVEQLREQHPLLDMVDHDRTPATTSTAPPQAFSQIEAVLLLGEPVRWETNLQLLVDVLLTDGRPSSAYSRPPARAQLPVIACNVDLLWMAEAPSPRMNKSYPIQFPTGFFFRAQLRPRHVPAVLGVGLQEVDGPRLDLRGAAGETQPADLPVRRTRAGPAEPQPASGDHLRRGRQPHDGRVRRQPFRSLPGSAMRGGAPPARGWPGDVGVRRSLPLRPGVHRRVRGAVCVRRGERLPARPPRHLRRGGGSGQTRLRAGRRGGRRRPAAPSPPLTAPAYGK
ncbi:haloacid dehalogenase-like hydrolase domain-containing 5 [Stigmatopora argus]